MSKRYHDFPYHPCKRQKRYLTSASRFSRNGEWEFDVFMSFRGEDVRENFADCLFDALDKEEIYTCKDDRTFDVGKDLSKILKAIEKSRLSIIIFSKNYADSTFCLDETVKIVERMDLKKHKAFPVFLTVSDSDVRETSKGEFKEAFDSHKQEFEDEEVERWKAALKRLANTSGFPRGGRKHFVELIEDIVYETLRKLNKIVSKIQQSCLKKGSELSNAYEGSHLIADVQEANERGGQVVPEQLLLALNATNLSIHDVVKRIILHMKLLCRKHKFDFLDDVDYCLNQLANSASDHPWFGSMSKIILTTKDKHVLTNLKIYKIHKVEPLNDYTTLELFRVSISIPSITIVEAVNKSRVDFEYLGSVTDHYVLSRGASICIHDESGIDGAKNSNSKVIECEIRAKSCKRIHQNHILSVGGIEEESGENHDSVEPITEPRVDDSGYNMKKDKGGNSDTNVKEGLRSEAMDASPGLQHNAPKARTTGSHGGPTLPKKKRENQAQLISKNLNFNLPIKLDFNNFIYWKAQVMSVIKAFDVEDFVLGPVKCPDKFIEVEDEHSGESVQAYNDEYFNWRTIDQWLLCWLRSTISESVQGQVINCFTSCEVWNTIAQLFSQQSMARVSHLRSQLHVLKKGASSIIEYMVKMKGIADVLMVAGQVISESDLVSYILGGLGYEYDPVVATIAAKRGDISLQEAQFLLMSFESRLEQLNSSNTLDHSTSNVPANILHRMHRGELPATYMRGSQFQGFSGRFRGRNRGRGGRSYNNTRPTCQLCGIVGHLAATCNYRFNETFNNNSGRMQTQSLQGNLAYEVEYMQDAPYQSRNNNGLL